MMYLPYIITFICKYHLKMPKTSKHGTLLSTHILIPTYSTIHSPFSPMLLYFPLSPSSTIHFLLHFNLDSLIMNYESSMDRKNKDLLQIFFTSWYVFISLLQKCRYHCCGFVLVKFCKISISIFFSSHKP